MLTELRRYFPERFWLRRAYHWAVAVFSAIWWGFPSRHRLTVIGVTGTSGKTSVTELLTYLLQAQGKKVGALSGVALRVGDTVSPNTSLRTTLRSWSVQKKLRQMVQSGVEVVVLEVSSHALDQHRLWGVTFDIGILTNLYEGEHLDYHPNFQHYLDTKKELFRRLNSYRKPQVPKVMVLPVDGSHYADFGELFSDQKITYSLHQRATLGVQNLNCSAKDSRFTIRLPNVSQAVCLPLLGEHNVHNALAALGGVLSLGLDPAQALKDLESFPGIPGRLEPIEVGQEFSLLVDHAYKPSALSEVLKQLKICCQGQLKVVWGPAGGRSEDNWTDSAALLHQYADEIILTTDDPQQESPERLAKIVEDKIARQEGEGFFRIPDRYEAIRYALYTAEEKDIVLIAGRGAESIQTIGKHQIPFDDRAVAKEILHFAQERVRNESEDPSPN